jgi:hypothetical protein
MGRNFNGTFMMKRRAERRSGAGMIFLLDLSGDQVELGRAEISFTKTVANGQAFFHFTKDCLWR